MAKKIEKEVEEIKEVEKEVLNDDYEEITLEERVINIEKKVKVSFWLNIVNVALIVFLLILLLGGGNATSSYSSEEGTEGSASGSTGSQATTTYDTSAFKTIEAADIEKESKNKTIVLWVGRQSCGYCTAYAPYIAEAAKNYGITAYYIDLATIVNFDVAQPYITDSTSWDTLSSLTGSGEWKEFASKNLGGTPLTLIIKNNKVIGGLSGYDEVSAIESAFKAAGIKKK